MIALGRLSLALALLGCSASCEAERPHDAAYRGQFGVFFGGQIQERRDLPFELDGARQSQGFRVEFTEPLARDVVVEWRIDRPASSEKQKKPRREARPEERVRTTSERAVARAGATRFDHVVPFEPGDPLGLWNVRVVVAGKVVIDRPFEVYDERARQRLAARDAGG